MNNTHGNCVAVLLQKRMRQYTLPVGINAANLHSTKSIDLADMKVMDEILDSCALTAFCCINTPDEVPDGRYYWAFQKFAGSA